MPTDSTTDHAAAGEAARLATLPAAVQQQVAALHRAVADDRAVPPRDRAEARRRATYLERRLGL